MRARDLGIAIGFGTPGPLNAITDVQGVRVGHTTLVAGEGPLEVGRGPVRTGVTVIVPHERRGEPVFAGCHRLSGNGELTGLEWVRESGQLTTPVAITNTHSVGIVRDALVAASVGPAPGGAWWALPVVGETCDGLLNDINGFHVRAEDVHAALDGAAGGAVAEGNVGGGTGMICHEFKGGIGTASRVVDARFGGFTVGVLVQANYGRREWLRVDGVPVGLEISVDEVPSPRRRSERGPAASPPAESGRGPAAVTPTPASERGPAEESPPPAAVPPDAASPAPGSGSIIVVVATDAPLLPHQCERVAQRAGLGIARAGGTGGHTSGDLFIAFATGNRLPPPAPTLAEAPVVHNVRAVGDGVIDALFDATIEATEEAIVNALVAADTMTGRDGITAHAIPHGRLREVMALYRRRVA